MSNKVRLPNKEARRCDALLRELGYRFDRISSGAWVYEHPAAPAYHLHCTVHKYGHNSFRRVRADMAIRHPDKVKRSNSSRPGKGATRARHALAAPVVVHPVEQPAPIVSAAVKRLRYTGCPDCGYRWKSDLDADGRPCPECDGFIVEVAAREAKPARVARQPWEPLVRRAA